MLKSKSLKLAGVFAYIFIIINTISGFLIGPAILSKVGDNVYGIYTTVNSLVSTLMIADLGVSQTLIRFIADYKVNKKSDEDIARFCKTIKSISYVLIIMTIIAGIVVYIVIPGLYQSTFSTSEIKTAQSLLLICMLSIVTTLLSNYYTGIIAGYGYFTYINITKTASILFKLILTILAVSVFANIYLVVWINSIISIIIYIVDVIFYKKIIDIKLNYGYAEMTVFKSMTIYTLLLFVQTIVDQINSNLDNIIIGVIVGTSAVTVYSFGLTVFHMFQQLSTSISQMLVPYMSDVIASGTSHTEIEDCLIKIGKIQFLIVGGIYFGFISFGKLFIKIWLGSGYGEVWIVAIILMSGGLIPLIQNGAIALLKAKNLMGFRTAALFAAAILNAFSTIILVYNFGFIYASAGTALGFVAINTIVMDTYYYKKLNINMMRVIWNIMRRALIIDFICAFVAYSVQMIFLMDNIVYKLAISASVFIILYCPLSYYFVLNRNERRELFGRFLKR